MTVFNDAIKVWNDATAKFNLDKSDSDWQELLLTMFNNGCNFNDNKLSYRSARNFELLWNEWQGKNYPNHIINCLVNYVNEMVLIKGKKRKPYLLDIVYYATYGHFEK